MKAKYLVASMLGIVILSLAVYSTLHSVSEINITNIDEPKTSNEDGFGSSIGVVLVIENERNGEIVHRMVKDDDLSLRSMAGLWLTMIKGTDVEVADVYRITDGVQTGILLHTSYHINPLNSMIRIGTGTTGATYIDWKLETEVYTDKVEAIGYSVAGLEMNCTFTATFNILGSYAITEAGVSTIYDAFSNTEFLIFRDTFSAINVISGDILTVEYIIMFN